MFLANPHVTYAYALGSEEKYTTNAVLQRSLALASLISRELFQTATSSASATRIGWTVGSGPMTVSIRLARPFSPVFGITASPCPIYLPSAVSAVYTRQYGSGSFQAGRYA